MSSEILTFIISLAGVIIMVLFAITGFFLKSIINDVKKCLEETGKNKGRIELVEQQQINDTERIEAMTQLELRSMSASVTELSKNVNILVTALAKKGINTNEN